MKIIQILILVGIQAFCIAQSGFNKKYDLDQISASFINIEYHEDTLIVSGNIVSENETVQHGALIVKMDTFGNILNHNKYFNIDGDLVTQSYTNSCIYDSEDSSYIYIGQYFFNRNGFLIKFRRDLSIDFVKEYSDPNSKTDIYKNIKIIQNGYIVSGYKQAINFVGNIFIKKINKLGNILWEKKYETPDMQTYITEMWINNDNEYIISASTNPLQGVSLPQMKFSSKIFAIDSLGIVKWQWQSPYGLDEMGALNISKTKDGHWAYFSSRGWFNEEFNEISIQPVFIVRDEQFNLIQYDTFGVADIAAPNNNFYKIIQVADGGWMAVGNKPVAYPGPPNTGDYNSLAGWMIRLDSEGNQVWNRTDTAYWDLETGSRNTLYNVIELPSGSFIACGKSRMFEPVDKEWGWIIKVDKDGCMDTLCTSTSISSYIAGNPEIKVYPIPTRDFVQFTLDDGENFKNASIYISDLYGKTIDVKKIKGLQNSISWDATFQPSGVYIYHLYENGILRYSGKFIVQK